MKIMEYQFFDGDHTTKDVVEPWNFICSNYKKYVTYRKFKNKGIPYERIFNK